MADVAEAEAPLVHGRREDDFRVAVRGAGLAAFLLLIAAGPLALFLAEPVASKADPGFPAWSWSAFLEGEWTSALEQHVEASSPIAYELRGLYAETAYAWGVLEHEQVAIRADEWFFHRGGWPDPERFEALAEGRRRHFAAVAQRAAALGVTVVVVIVPAKSTVYPDRAFDSPEPQRQKLAMLEQAWGEMRAVGLVPVDVLPALGALRAAGTEVFFKRDTHWNTEGAFAAAQAVAAAIGATGFSVSDGAAVDAERVGVHLQPTRPNLAEILGMRMDLPRGATSSHAVVRSLQEHKDVGYVMVRPAGADRAQQRPLDGSLPGAEVALAGTSFSGSLGPALVFALRTEINTTSVRAGSNPLDGIYPVLDRIEAGALKARVVVWEFPERLLYHPIWNSVSGA